MKHCLLLMAAALAAACSTTAAPGVCCIGREDCGRLGLAEDRLCPAGQACVDLLCVVPSCSTQGCTADAPVCDVTTDVCTGCTASSDCSRFSEMDICDSQTGACVECLAQVDCTDARKPVCDGNSCRVCRLDAECPSGACGEDGACVPETNIIYLRPDGLDAGTCPRGAPCKRIQFGVTRTSLSRNHIVLTAGLYDLGDGSETITSLNTPAQRLFLHGGGSVISTTGEVDAISTEVDLVVRDLEIVGGSGGIHSVATGRGVLERVKFRNGGRGIAFYGDVLMQEISFENVAYPLLLRGAARLTLDRGIIKNPYIAISSNAYTTVVDISNLLVYGAVDVAFNLGVSAGGTVSFTTIADSGTDSGSGPRAFQCPPSGLTIRSSIIWAPGTVARPAIDGGCTLASSIVGPTAVPGATNVDPLFVDAAGRNYRLGLGSPARDMVDTGPAADFEGDPRPQGARFDIGADEGL
jgi:hypothetical protein